VESLNKPWYLFWLTGIEQAPVFSYIRSRGFYAGVSIMGQVFIGEQAVCDGGWHADLAESAERFEENGAMYHWPGIKGKDIVSTVDLSDGCNTDSRAG
jgi:hypothetical protein